MKAQSWRFCLAAALVGALSGLVGAAFHALLDLAISGRASLHGWLAAWPVPGWLPLMLFCAPALTGALWLVRRVDLSTLLQKHYTASQSVTEILRPRSCLSGSCA